MFSPGFVIQTGNNYGVVKTETVFGFGPDNNFDQNGDSSEPLELFFGEGTFGRSFKESDKSSQMQLKTARNGNRNNKIMQRKHSKKHSKHKVKKCIYKLLKGKKQKFLKKFLLPLLIGIVAAKSLLLPLALKALAFVSFKAVFTLRVKLMEPCFKLWFRNPNGFETTRPNFNKLTRIQTGLLIGFVSATMLSLRGIVSHSYGYHHRRDDGDKIKNIYVPSKPKVSYKKQRNDLISQSHKEFRYNSKKNKH